MGLADPQPACPTSAFFVVVPGFSHAETDYRDFDSGAAKKFVHICVSAGYLLASLSAFYRSPVEWVQSSFLWSTYRLGLLSCS